MFSKIKKYFSKKKDYKVSGTVVYKGYRAVIEWNKEYSLYFITMRENHIHFTCEGKTISEAFSSYIEWVDECLPVKLFLNLLEKDIEQFPERLEPLSENLLNKINDLVGDLDIDLEQPLSFEQEDMV